MITMDEQLKGLVNLRAALVNSFLHHYLPVVDWAIEEIQNLNAAMLEQREKLMQQNSTSEKQP